MKSEGGGQDIKNLNDVALSHVPYKKVLIIGSGPIVIGQACEFDYSGTQACKALTQLGLEVILVNSNPATIMTDPDVASKVYIEPLKESYLKKIIEVERPEALIPTLGGQTALNLALELNNSGVLKEFGVKLLGATPEAIYKAEDRGAFNKVLEKVGAQRAPSVLVQSFEQGMSKIQNFEFPVILRPNFTLGGGGGGVAYSVEEYKEKLAHALLESPSSEVLVEKSMLGWSEYELEVMRDREGTFVVVCSIENIDPCGVHTGDSMAVAPQQTLTDREYQAMRDEAQKIVEEVGIETGGANIQFAVHPTTRQRIVIEMNPRVSRSSALASKATGFPIAKIAALLAVGYCLEDIKNDITGVTPSCYEPALDYVVTKIPCFAFEKFPGSKDLLTTQMKSVGEVMGIGRTFKESLNKAFISLEGHSLVEDRPSLDKEKISYPHSRRLVHIFEGLRQGYSVHELYEMTQIHPWFLEQFEDLVRLESEALKLGEQIEAFEKKKVNSDSSPNPPGSRLSHGSIPFEGIRFSMENGSSMEENLFPVEERGSSTERDLEFSDLKNLLLKFKRHGFPDEAIGFLLQKSPEKITNCRRSLNIRPTFYQVDTCAGEFDSQTPYLYSTYWGESTFPKSLNRESKDQSLQRALVIGSGPNRIGQGIEFDYGCVRCIKALKNLGFQTIMVNSNPETVSTDYDTSDILFFEPLHKEFVSEVCHWVQPDFFIPQLGGQTSLGLAAPLEKEGFSILGSSLKTIDLAEDRGHFVEIVKSCQANVPQSGVAASLKEAFQIVKRLGYPLMVRPSYVLGGRRMEILETDAELEIYFKKYKKDISFQHPCLMDQFLEEALEIDVDLVRSKDWKVIGGVVEHIEAAGVHSGDSMGVLPPQRLKPETLQQIEDLSLKIADRLGIEGFLNLQLAVKRDQVFVIEANPRSSRTMPFIAKATGIPIVDLGVLAMLGRSVDVKPFDWKKVEEVAVKGVSFPFNKFPNQDSILGPEMKSTGESMGRGETYSEALLKAMLSTGISFPQKGEVFLSLRDKDKKVLLPFVQSLMEMGFTLSATGGTADFLESHGLACLKVKKVHQGRPHCVDRIRSGVVAFVVNTTSGKQSVESSFSIRRSCIDYSIPCLTEVDAAKAFLLAFKDQKREFFGVSPLKKGQNVLLSHERNSQTHTKRGSQSSSLRA